MEKNEKNRLQSNYSPLYTKKKDILNVHLAVNYYVSYKLRCVFLTENLFINLVPRKKIRTPPFSLAKEYSGNEVVYSHRSHIGETTSKNVTLIYHMLQIYIIVSVF